jgi:superoxide dismutase, Fe-Mn family
MPYTLPQLPYTYSDLKKSIDPQTMEIHHTKHHQTYVDKLNEAIKGTAHAEAPLEKLLHEASRLPLPIRNNGGGHYNHTFFWTIMSPHGGGRPRGDIASALTSTFGNFERFKDEFSEVAAKQFGSGWAWLIVNRYKKLELTSTPNQDSPIMDVAVTTGTPILGLDVWEHAYYLKYQNRRPEYISAFFDVINWDEANRRLSEALRS